MHRISSIHDDTSSRRAFVSRALTLATLVVSARALRAQGRNAVHDSTLVPSTSTIFKMDQSAAETVRLPPKPNAKPSMTDRERDELEHQIHCQCGCTLDVITCRTTMLSCEVSPAMHRDIIALVNGGYDAQEILDAFVNVYGERALMAPKKSGFNLVGWLMPGIAFAIGGATLTVLLKRWGSRARTRQRSRAAGAAASGFVATRGDSDATDEELAQLEALVRGRPLTSNTTILITDKG